VSAAGGLRSGAGGGKLRLRKLEAGARATMAILFRTPRPESLRLARLTAPRFAAAAAIAVSAIVLTMILIDPWSIANVRRLPVPLVEALDRLTDLGKSGWFLWPTGLLMIALALRDNPALPSLARAVLAAWTVRVGFVFLAIAVPGVFVGVVKRLIGRARPLVEGHDVWAYQPFGWQVEYASMPSGHATTAFAALVAIGAIFPHARALMWIYAVMIGFSRIAITAHHPSDVLAGAIVGAFGAVLVRDWFAARRLGFVVGADGRIRPLPGPNFRRILKAVAQSPRAA